MSDDLKAFCYAMDGQWKVISVGPAPQSKPNRYTVRYQSLLVPSVTWSQDVFSEFIPPQVGTVGRIGFVSSGQMIDE